MVSILFLFLPVLLLVGIVILFIKKKDKFTKEEWKVVLNDLYLHSVLFVTLMITIGGSLLIYSNMVDWIVSKESFSFTLEEFENTHPFLSNEEIKIAYEKESLLFEQSEKRLHLRTLISSFGWVLIPLPLFLHFRRKVSTKHT